jgi:hypothetical protein
MSGRGRAPLQVTIVATNRATLEGLQSYMTRAGVRARSVRRVADIGADPCSALVVFPDEFHSRDVLLELRRIRRERPKVLSLIVTREPHRFAELVDDQATGAATVVLPKPVWGWTILDAIRARFDQPRSD